MAAPRHDGFVRRAALPCLLTIAYCTGCGDRMGTEGSSGGAESAATNGEATSTATSESGSTSSASEAGGTGSASEASGSEDSDPSESTVTSSADTDGSEDAGDDSDGDTSTGADSDDSDDEASTDDDTTGDGTTDDGTDNGTADDGTTDDADTGDDGGTDDGDDWDPDDFDHIYRVGPGQEYEEIEEVPWEALRADTLVTIDWRPEPYRAKWVINTVATSEEPLVILGLADDGRRPEISGTNARTRLELSYWNEPRSIIKVGGSNLPSDDLVPAHITIQGLDISGARGNFFNDAGEQESYADNAAAIHVEVGEHVDIVDCELHDAGNGLFSGHQTAQLRIVGNHIHGNGNPGSIYEHNSYTESKGILFEGNHYGPLCDDCRGNNLKDRSAGTVVRYNWIEGGNRQLDLVESDYDELIDDPAYRQTHVYGNALMEPDGAGNSQILHYGGDGGDTAKYRKGTLFFYHNTIVSLREGNTTLHRLSSNDESAELYANLLYVSSSGSSLALSAGSGTMKIQDNCLPSGWEASHGDLDGSIDDLGNVETADPGLADAAGGDLTPREDSDCLNANVLPMDLASTHPVEEEFTAPTGSTSRPVQGDIDRGAFEAGAR